MHEFPYETLRHIIEYLEPRDRFACLTVCRVWKRPAQDILRQDVHVNGYPKFLSFCQKLNRDKFDWKTKITGLMVTGFRYDMYTTTAQRNTFETRMKTLLLELVNLENIKINFDCVRLPYDWSKNLHKLKSVSNRNCSDALLGLRRHGKQLTSLEMGYVYPFSAQLNSLSSFSNLQSLSLGLYSSLSLENLGKIHSSAPGLQNLFVQSDISTDQVQTSLISAYSYNLVSLTCSIDSDRSAWFSIIKSNYSSLKNLTLKCSSSQVYKWTNNHTRSIIDLHQNTQLKSIEIMVKRRCSNHAINDLLYRMIQRYDKVDHEIALSLHSSERTDTSTFKEYRNIRINNSSCRDERQTIFYNVQVAIDEGNETLKGKPVKEMQELQYIMPASARTFVRNLDLKKTIDRDRQHHQLYLNQIL